MALFRLVLLVAGGALVALVLNIHGLQNSEWYSIVITTLLAIGLYASTYGIDLREARQHSKIIISAVTVGVIFKAAFTGLILTILFRDPFFFILGIAVAQIDPLSVAGLMKGSRMSKKAKTILSSWASFDDPVTVLLSLYAPLLVMQITGFHFGSIGTSAAATNSLAAYVREIGLNFGLAALVFCLYTTLRFYAKQITARAAAGVSIATYVLLAVSFSASIACFAMLGIALIGLFLRPVTLEKTIDKTVAWALGIAALLLGLLLIDGASVWQGVMLGIMAYVSQTIVGLILTRKLSKKDRWHIALAQQNGITAIILALLFEQSHPGTVAIVAPAIIVINTLHWMCNSIMDRYFIKTATN